MMYKCDRCGYETNRNSSLINHQNRKILCDNNELSYKCEFCNKGFKNNRNMQIHINKRCKKKKQIDEDILKTDILTRQLEKRLSKIENYCSTIIDNPNNNIVNNNIVNNNVNIVNNIDVKINITIYGYELPKRTDGSQVELNSYHTPNLEYVPQDVVALLPKNNNHLAATIENIYFNPKHPENHAIGYYNHKRKTCRVFREGKFETEKIDHITDVVSQHLKEVFDSGKRLVDEASPLEVKLKELFKMADEIKKSQTKFYNIRDLIIMKVEDFDRHNMRVDINPDDIPPLADTKEYEEWKVLSVRSRVVAELDERVRALDGDQLKSLEFFIMLVKGGLNQLDVILNGIRNAASVESARELSARVESIRATTKGSLEMIW